ncbi:MAG: hypothetical protein JWR80_4270 [Bradyrhizobium sp.]|jgi:hypothetical protein|nr:hypothetical protein [Bradyrhizobium sp.]
MNTTTKLLAASALFVAFAAPAFAIEPLSQQLEERNTYTNPAQAGWTSNAMESRSMSRHHAAMNMQGPTWRTQNNVSPSSMDSGLEQQR